jgi:hypothetical protein
MDPLAVLRFGFWGTVLAILFAPSYRRLLTSMGERRNLAALATVLIVLMMVILPFSSFDDLIRSRQHVGRDRHADLLGRLKVDHQLELCRLLNRNVGWLGAFENLVNHRR